MSICLGTKWLWVQIPLQSLKLYISHLIMPGVSWHSGNYRVWIHSETRTWHVKNIQSIGNLIQIYTSLIGLEKHTNQLLRLLNLLTPALFLQKLLIFWKKTVMASREKNYVLINCRGIFETSWSIAVNFIMYINILVLWTKQVC